MNQIACLWFSVDKCVFGYEKDLLCGAVYLPPEGTKYSDMNLFDDFEGDLLHINANNTFQVLMTGDFNSRINKLNECVTFDYESFHELQFDEAIADILSDEESLERLDIPVVRKTEDNVCNNYGHYVYIIYI